MVLDSSSTERIVLGLLWLSSGLTSLSHSSAITSYQLETEGAIEMCLGEPVALVVKFFTSSGVDEPQGFVECPLCAQGCCGSVLFL